MINKKAIEYGSISLCLSIYYLNDSTNEENASVMIYNIIRCFFSLSLSLITDRKSTCYFYFPTKKKMKSAIFPCCF